MPWNGSGAFTRVYSWQADAAAGIDISASRTDTDTNDITSNGFGNCLTRDGQGAAAANLPMNGFKHTGAAVAAASDEYVTLGQITAASLAGKFTSVTITTGGLLISAGGATITGAVTLANALNVGGTLGVTGAATAPSFSASGLMNAGTITSSGSITATGSITGSAGVFAGLMSAGTVQSTGAISGQSGSIVGSLAVGTIGAGAGAITSLTVGAAAGSTNPPQWGQVLGGNAAAWNDVSGSRSIGSTYTNSSTKPLALSVVGTSGSTAQISATVAGALFAGTYATTGVNLGVVAIVPIGATYSVNISAGTPTLGAWRELS